MRRFEAHEGVLSPDLLARYAANVKRWKAREDRFPSHTLLMFSASGVEGFKITAAEGDAPTEILLYDEIGYWGVTAKEFALALAAAGPGPLKLRINSPGGDVFDGLAIYNMLKARTSPVTVMVDGIAASAASFIAMAGSQIIMPEQAMLMIHNCWGLCVGNRNDMLKMAAEQQKIDGMMAELYAAKSGQTVDAMSAAMDAETYYTSTEAKAIGLCDLILPAADKSSGVDAAMVSLAQHVTADIARAFGVPAARLRADLPAYDPDNDGDNDAVEALSLIQAASKMLAEAVSALTGSDGDGDAADDSMPVVPGARSRQEPLQAAEQWSCGAARDMSVSDSDAAWDGPAAEAHIFEAAGFNGDNPDPDKAKRYFLAFDSSNPKEKGSYKLPFATPEGGVTRAGVDAAASRLPQTDIPDSVKGEARAVLDGYEKKLGEGKDDSGKASRLRRLRVAEALSK